MANNSYITEKFYVQRLARQALNRVAALPPRWEVGKKLPYDLSPEEWLTALSDYRRWLITVLELVQREPETFGMPCCPIDYKYNGPVTKEEQKSLKSFARLGNTLNALAKIGTITNDGGIYCSFEELKEELKYVKIPKMNAILEGLTASGWCLLREDHGFYLYDCDNRNTFYVFKVFAAMDGYDGLMTADIRYLVKNPNEPINYTVSDITCQMLPHQQALVTQICDRFAQCGYCIKVEYGYNPARIRIAKTKSGKDCVTIVVERDDRVGLNLRLEKISEYADILHTLSSNIQAQTLTGRDCCYCGYCKEGCVRFTFGKNEYEKCSLICCGFSYIDPSPQDTDSLLRLIHCEWAV